MGAHFRCCRSDKREASEILARSGHCNRGGCCKDHCENEKVQQTMSRKSGNLPVMKGKRTSEESGLSER